MIGEMRDLETIYRHTAETGHLVLATLHTINSAQTVERIVDVSLLPAGPGSTPAANRSRAVLSQRLLRLIVNKW